MNGIIQQKNLFPDEQGRGFFKGFFFFLWQGLKATRPR